MGERERSGWSIVYGGLKKASERPEAMGKE
jgi:hypothetical protein